MNELLNEFRLALSEGGEFGMLVTADRMEESDDETANRFGELLRKYVEIQTCFRMSQVPPTALAKRYDELNKSFGTKPTKTAPGGGTYSKPFGPCYTALEIEQTQLMANLNVLVDEPIRELTIRYASAGNDLSMILRNYRVETMYQLSIHVYSGYGSRRDSLAQGIAQCLRELKAPMMMRVSIAGVVDTKKHLQLFFQMSKVAKGCELWVSPTSYGTPVHVCSKRM